MRVICQKEKKREKKSDRSSWSSSPEEWLDQIRKIGKKMKKKSAWIDQHILYLSSSPVQRRKLACTCIFTQEMQDMTRKGWYRFNRCAIDRMDYATNTTTIAKDKLLLIKHKKKKKIKIEHHATSQFFVQFFYSLAIYLSRLVVLTAISYWFFPSLYYY